MSKSVDIAVVGASGTVGQLIIELLEERSFPVGKLFVLAEEDLAGGRVEFQGKQLVVRDVARFDFQQAQIAFFAGSEALSRQYAPVAADAGCIVIDRTPAFRNDAQVPLVVPEVNPEAIAGYKQRNIIANPSCMSIQLAVALKPLYEKVGIKRINVATYQAVSGSGTAGSEELATQTAALLNFRDIKPKTFSKQIAFNVIPHIDEFENNGYTREEMKMISELQKLFADDQLQINPTAVRVPVFIGHSAAVHIETRDKIDREQALGLLTKAKGVKVIDKQTPGSYPTPVSEAAGNDAVFVGRVREDLSHPHGLDLWLVTDNLRKGAGLNSVQIAEILVKLYT